MNSFSTYINDLLDKEVKINSDDYLLSIYFPAKHFSKLQVKKRLKSLILLAFRNNLKLKSFSRLHQKVAESVFEKTEKIDEFKKGLAIFVKFNSLKQEKERIKKIPEKDIKVISLYKEPEKEAYIGKTYDLDQLVWIDSVSYDALVLNLSEKFCDIYILDGEGLRRLTRINNMYTINKEDEYLEKHSPLTKRKIFYSTGFDKKDKDREKKNEYFIQSIYEFMNKNAFQKRFDYCLCFYSPSFYNVIANLKGRIKEKPFTYEAIFETKNIQKETDLKKASEDKINKLQKDSKKKLLSLAKQDNNSFVNGWNAVTKADRLRKIDNLFIKALAKKKGYLLDKKYVYTYPLKNTRFVRNIAPWLVRNVVNSSGKIIVFKDNSAMEAEVAAELRY